MVAGGKWPRPGYSRAAGPDVVLHRLALVDAGLRLTRCFERPRNDPVICQQLQGLRAEFPDVVESMALSKGPAEIIQLWGASCDDAARQGAYMH